MSSFTVGIRSVIHESLELVDVPAGNFMMGGSRANEQPIHEVSVPEFAIGKYPVTQAQWKAVMGTDPSYFKGDNHPVEQVSWYYAQEFCRRLSEITGQTFRLPSEAEWEYACRAGSTGKYCFGDDPKQLGDYAWYAENSDDTTHPVGQKLPNAFGLYDMHGNVWEWCQDDWHPNYKGAPTDGSAWEGDSPYKIVRGGSWFNSQLLARAISRNYFRPANRDFNVGFRVLCCRPSSS